MRSLLVLVVGLAAAAALPLEDNPPDSLPSADPLENDVIPGPESDHTPAPPQPAGQKQPDKEDAAGEAPAPTTLLQVGAQAVESEAETSPAPSAATEDDIRPQPPKEDNQKTPEDEDMVVIYPPPAAHGVTEEQEQEEPLEEEQEQEEPLEEEQEATLEQEQLEEEQEVAPGLLSWLVPGFLDTEGSNEDEGQADGFLAAGGPLGQEMEAQLVPDVEFVPEDEDEEEVFRPEGEVFRPENILIYEGEIFRPEEEVFRPEGEAFTPEEEVFGHEGMFGPEGDMFIPEGENFDHDEESFRPEGDMFTPEGEMFGPEGEMLGPEGEVAGPGAGEPVAVDTMGLGLGSMAGPEYDIRFEGESPFEQELLVPDSHESEEEEEEEMVEGEEAPMPIEFFYLPKDSDLLVEYKPVEGEEEEEEEDVFPGHMGLDNPFFPREPFFPEDDQSPFEDVFGMTGGSSEEDNDDHDYFYDYDADSHSPFEQEFYYGDDNVELGVMEDPQTRESPLGMRDVFFFPTGGSGKKPVRMQDLLFSLTSKVPPQQLPEAGGPRPSSPTPDLTLVIVSESLPFNSSNGISNNGISTPYRYNMNEPPKYFSPQRPSSHVSEVSPSGSFHFSTLRGAPPPSPVHQHPLWPTPHQFGSPVSYDHNQVAPPAVPNYNPHHDYNFVPYRQQQQQPLSLLGLTPSDNFRGFNAHKLPHMSEFGFPLSPATSRYSSLPFGVPSRQPHHPHPVPPQAPHLPQPFLNAPLSMTFLQDAPSPHHALPRHPDHLHPHPISEPSSSGLSSRFLPPPQSHYPPPSQDLQHEPLHFTIYPDRRPLSSFPSSPRSRFPFLSSSYHAQGQHQGPFSSPSSSQGPFSSPSSSQGPFSFPSTSYGSFSSPSAPQGSFSLPPASTPRFHPNTLFPPQPKYRPLMYL